MPNDQAHDTRVTLAADRLAQAVGLNVAAVASGGGSEPGAAPEISSFSGTFGQGNTMTLNGSFSAERDGMVAYMRGDPNNLGASPAELVDFNGSAASDYKHSTERAFGKSGASLRADWFDGNPQNNGANIRLPAKSRKLFLSAEVFMDLSGWNADTSGTAAAPQVKFMRLLGESGSHTTLPTQHIQTKWFDSRNGAGVGLDYPFSTNIGNFRNEQGASFDWGSPPGLTGWQRWILYGEVSTTETSEDGRMFARMINHVDNTIHHCDRTYVDGSPTMHSDRSWLAPAVKNFEHGANPDPRWINAMLPFYKINVDNLVVFVDLVGVNDTPERVELGNNPSMDDCTKLVLQKQLSRNGSTITFEVEEGNFAATDNIYAFVVNGDTQYTAGTLIRAGS